MTSANHPQPLLIPQPPVGEEPRVTAIFSAIEQTLGFVPDGLRLYSISPPLLEAFVANIAYFRGGTKLSPVLTAMIRYLVSAEAGCHFCIDLNESFLSHLGVDLDIARSARLNPELAPIDERERPLLRLALKAIDAPDAVSATDLQAARALGWQDREIFDAVVQAANNRAFNHVLRTFKVERQGVFA
jgi:alkylhydroperoxidase family enzyme